MTTNDKYPSSASHRRPPVEHQFKKGQSGNPNGRPKKKLALPAGIAASDGGIFNRLNSVVLDEGMRVLSIKDGDKTYELTALQASIRTLMRASAKGDTKAARQVLELFSQAETSRAAQAMEHLSAVLGYTEFVEQEREKCERAGIDPPEFYPAPEDISIDERNGQVTIDGPISKQDAGAYEAMRADVYKKLPRIFELRDAVKKNPKDKNLRRELAELKPCMDFLDRDGERHIRRETHRLARQAQADASAKTKLKKLRSRDDRE